MSKVLSRLLVVCTCLSINGQLPSAAARPPVANPVVEWNRALLAIVRTPGAQPATIHATRSFAMMHAAIYDAVNAINSVRPTPSACVTSRRTH